MARRVCLDVGHFRWVHMINSQFLILPYNINYLQIIFCDMSALQQAISTVLVQRGDVSTASISHKISVLVTPPVTTWFTLVLV